MALNNADIIEYIETHIPNFHQRRLDKLMSLNLYDVIRRKNPYLFKAKNINTAGDLVKSILEAHLSSQEETIFGTFLEGLAIFICQKVHNGRKSPAEGIDLEFEKDEIIYLVAIKSGPNWGNSQQIARMLDNFRKAKRILKTNAVARNVVAVNGCCYGREAVNDKGEYLKLCGESFWHFISNIPTLYTDIVEPLGYKAKERNAEFDEEYAKVQNRFTRIILEEFCTADDKVDWEKLVQFNSALNIPRKPWRKLRRD